MARKKDFFSSMVRAAAQMEKLQRANRREAERVQNAVYKEHARAQKEYDRAKAAEQKAVQQEIKVQQTQSKAEQVAAVKEEKAKYLEMRLKKVDLLNADINEKVEQLKEILHTTLEVDDYVDLDKLKKVAPAPIP
ncbi:MAG: hypothetical protein ABI210_10890, partial [Abditibacteriaceae bacterium]